MQPTNNPYNAPSHASPAGIQSASVRTVSVRRIDAFSVAMMVGAMYALIGVIAGLVFFTFSLLGGLAGGAEMAVGGFLFGGMMLVALPVGYGLAGFVAGLVGGLIYNVAASFVGGVRMDLGS